MTTKTIYLALCCIVALAGCGNASSIGDASATNAKTSEGTATNPADAASSSRVRTARIRAMSIERSVLAYGTVSGGANEQASLAFPVPGRIDRISVNVGDHVSAGDVLARLDPRPLQAEVNEAQANVQAAEANLEKIRLASRPQQIVSTNAQLTQAKTQLAIANAQQERQQRLVSLGISTKTDLEAARSANASARAQVRVYEQQLSTQQHPWQPDIDAARAGLAQSQAALSAARDRLGRTTLAAPFAGTITGRLHSDGETVDTTAPVVQIASNQPPAFTAQFAPEDVTRIHVGAAAKVTLQGSNAKTDGVVVARNVAQSTSRMVPVVIRLTTESPDFGPGAYGSARIVIGIRHGLVVPAVSIVSDAATGVTQIFRKDGERFTPVPVDVIDREDGRALIVGFGLRDGQTVAAEGADELVAPQQAPKRDAD